MSSKEADDPLLIAPLLKIERAEHHISDLDRVLKAYLDGKPIRLMTSIETQSGNQTHFIKQDEPIPRSAPLIIGDAVHNMRSALDLTIFGMIGHKARNPDTIQFPFAKRQESLESSLQSRQVQIAGKKVVDTIKSLKPYPGGNRVLHAIHALDVADKHKLIIVVIAIGEMGGVDLAPLLPGVNVPVGVRAQLGMNVRFNIIRDTKGGTGAHGESAHPYEFERDCQPAFQILFGDGQPLSGQPIIPALIAMLRVSRLIVTTLVAAYRS